MGNATQVLRTADSVTRNTASAAVDQAMAQLSTLRVVRSEALVRLEAMCALKLTEKHFHRLMEHLPEMVLNVKQALAQASQARGSSGANKKNVFAQQSKR